MKKYKCNNYEICPEIREYLGHVKDIHEKNIFTQKHIDILKI